MDTKKVLIGTLVAGVSMFFLGWLIYGMLLSGFMEANCDHSGSRPMDQMIWWAIIVSNLVWGLLLSLILSWSGMMLPGPAAKVGAILGLLAALGFDLSVYSMSTMYSNLMVIIVDALAFCAMFAISGALAGWAMSRTNKTVLT